MDHFIISCVRHCECLFNKLMTFVEHISSKRLTKESLSSLAPCRLATSLLLWSPFKIRPLVYCLRCLLLLLLVLLVLLLLLIMCEFQWIFSPFAYGRPASWLTKCAHLDLLPELLTTMKNGWLVGCFGCFGCFVAS